MCLALVLFSSQVQAHGGHGEADHKSIEAYIALMREIAELSPEVIADPTTDLSHAELRLNGERIEMNSAFWQMVRGWIRVYYREMQHECDHCLNVSEDELARQAEDVAARSFWSRKIATPIRHSAAHVAIGTADLGARLGKVALVAKATSEVAETILSKTIGGGGVHVVCTVIDAAIIFGSRNIQVIGRVGGLNPFQLARLGWVSMMAKRIQRKVQFKKGFLVGPSDIFDQVDLEGPNRWWGWASEGKRAQFLDRVLRKDQVQVDGREFLGKRKKRYLFMKARRRGHSQYMAGRTGIDPLLNQDVLWVLEVQESILHRGLDRDPAIQMLKDPNARTWIEQNTPQQNAIRAGLAEEFSAEKQEWIESLLREVEVIYNPKVARSARYFQAQVLESVLSGFVYGVFNQVLTKKGELYGDSWGAISRRSRLHWQAGRFASYIYEWADFLRAAALSGSEAQLAEHRHESMEVLLRIFKHLQNAKILVEAQTVADLVEFEKNSRDGFQRLSTFKPWREKKSAHSWLPWGRRANCEKMHEVGT